MTLRAVTIWMTGLMLSVMIAVPTIQHIIWWFHRLDMQLDMLLHVISSASYIWMGSGWPLVVSYFISRNLKCPTSSAFLLLSTIAYGIFYIHVFYVVFTPGTDGMAILALYFLGLFSLPIMIPVWITVLVMNMRYNKSLNQG